MDLCAEQFWEKETNSVNKSDCNQFELQRPTIPDEHP